MAHSKENGSMLSDIVISSAAPPFQMSFNAQITKLNIYSIEGRLKEENLADWLLEEVAELLREAPEICVQLNHQFAHIDTPVLEINSCRIEQQVDYLDLSLHFAQSAPIEYLQILDELKKSTSYHKD